MQTNLKIRLITPLYFILLIIFISSCSTKKNTSLSRFSQATNTRFNVYFNGYVSYNEGLNNIITANKDDYSTVIPMYPISHHENASAATSSMDRTIEKCRKAIKLHSIKVKPKKDYKKANQPDYLLFYNQQEFNPALKDAWMLLAKAEFHKGDFLGSVGSFMYVAKMYAIDKDIVAQCQLWITRAYSEMGWTYEAEQVLSKINQDDLNRSSIGLFASVNADLLVKKHLYSEAIPFLELALSKAENKKMEQRFGFLLAQLYQRTKNNNAAYDYYSKVIKSNPPYEMDFNARINRAQLSVGDMAKVRKELKSMLKNRNNKEYLDQLYYAIGNTYLQAKDTASAIENYKLSVEKSTRKGLDQAVSSIQLGDIYYNDKNYVLAQPRYDEASKIITKEQDDFTRVTKRAETLSELMVQDNIVQLQDSLQGLSVLPQSKQLEIVNKIIENLIADEKKAAQKALQDAQNAAQNPEDELASLTPIGGPLNGNTDWYFYNPSLIRNGQAEFKKKWGQRKLEDNWRRMNKTASLFADDKISSEVAAESKSTTDSVASNRSELSDNKKPEFYLKQIPTTTAQIKKSNEEIADALYAMGYIYKEKIEDVPMAIVTFNQFISRFNNDTRVPEVYYQLYLLQTKQGEVANANTNRTKLINDFPKSKYAEMLSQPDYVEKLTKMYHEQDSIYALTYKAYLESDFATVSKNVDFVKQNFPLSTLMPKFLFLNALSVGKKESADAFEKALDELITQYPESDVSAMSKDMLALMKQGREVKAGSTSGSLLALRDKETKTETADEKQRQFSTDKQTKHRLLLITETSTANMNKLLFNIASFNFSRFMIKDFDLVVSKIDSTHNALSITNLESYEESQWYQNSLLADSTLSQLMNNFAVQKVIISEENFALLRTVFTMNDYLSFAQKNLMSGQAKQNITVASVSKPTPTTVAPKSTSVKVPDVKIATEIKTKAEKETEQTQKTADIKIASQPEKVAEKVVEKTAEVKPVSTATSATVTAATVQPKLPDVPLFKGLFAYRANEPHYVALYIFSGTVDFAKLKTELDAYNSKNYGMINLKVSMENVAKQQIIIIGSMADANVAKSYLLRFVKEKGQFEGLKNANYRNLLGSQSNLNILMQQNALNVYFEFMQQYYLK